MLSVGAVVVSAAAGPAASRASAQAPLETVTVGVSVGAQMSTQRLSEAIELDEYIEAAPVTARTGNGGVPFVDLGATVRIRGNWGASVALSYLSGHDASDVTARIPHPFYFDQARSVAGTVQRVRHREIAVHTGAAYGVPLARVDLVFTGGPSFFSVEQDFVTDVTIVETFPYDTATFNAATLRRATASRVGYHAAADLTWRAGRSWGVGAVVRFSRADVPFSAGGLDFGTMRTGGLQAGAGLRLIF
jgi:hypothetical protein